MSSTAGSSEDSLSLGHDEDSPDPNVIEFDPTNRYLRVWFFIN